jgi:hypothetical protein
MSMRFTFWPSTAKAENSASRIAKRRVLRLRGGGRRRLLAALALPFLLAACDDLRTDATSVYVLHDISGTYFRELPENLLTNKQLLLQMRARDQMSIAQIVDCSFTDRAVITRLDIPDRPSERNNRITGVAGQLDRFGAAAKQTPFTDIRGALLQAAAELRASKASRRLLVVFSDMQEDPAPTCRRDPTARIDLSGIAVVAANVAKLEADNRNPQGYFSRLDGWRNFVESNGGRFGVVSDPKELAELLHRRG